MAKKSNKSKKSEPKTTKSTDEAQFTVDTLVNDTGLLAASVRVALRELGVEKEFGNSYGWSTKKSYETVLKALKERSAKRVVPAKEEKVSTKKDKGGKKRRGKK